MSDDVYMTINGKRHTAKIIADRDPINPRTDYDHCSTMYCWHRNYNLGDYKENSYRNGGALFEDLLYEAGVHDEDGYALDEEALEARFPDSESIEKELRKAGYTMKPLYIYDHSGITISTGAFTCPWDSGQVGWAVITPQKFKEWCGRDWAGSDEDVAEAERIIENEVEEYDKYLTGDVWGIVIEDQYGEDADSVWGFYGSDYAEQMARELLEYHDKQEIKPFKGVDEDFDELREIEAKVRMTFRDIRNGVHSSEVAKNLLDLANDLRDKRMKIKARRKV